MHGMLLTADPARFAEGVALTEQAVADARQAGNALQVISASRALAWHYLLDGRFADAQAQGRLGARASWSGADSEPRRPTSTWRRAGCTTACASTATISTRRCAARPRPMRSPRRRPTAPCRAASASLLAQIHFVRANYAEARQWAERSLTTAEAIGNVAGVHRALALALAARCALGETINFARHADDDRGGHRPGRQRAAHHPRADRDAARARRRRVRRRSWHGSPRSGPPAACASSSPRSRSARSRRGAARRSGRRRNATSTMRWRWPTRSACARRARWRSSAVAAWRWPATRSTRRAATGAARASSARPSA